VSVKGPWPRVQRLAPNVAEGPGWRDQHPRGTVLNLVSVGS